MSTGWNGGGVRVEILGSNLYITRKLLGMNKEDEYFRKDYIRDAVADNMVWFDSALLLNDSVKM